MIDLFNNLIMKKARKDYRFRVFTQDFKAKIQISIKDDSINRYITFDGDGGITYSQGKTSDPDGVIIFRSIKDATLFIRNFGDIYEGMLENRFETKGNINILLKYIFLTSFINPKKKINIEGLNQEVINEFNK